MDPTFEDEVQQIAEHFVQEEQAALVLPVVYHMFRTISLHHHLQLIPLGSLRSKVHLCHVPNWDGNNNTRNMFDAVAINMPKYVAPVFK